MWGGPSHARMHQAENQAHGHESQLPWRRGRLGIIIPVATLAAAAVAVVVLFIVA